MNANQGQSINWLNDLTAAWGEKGVISLTAFFGSLFAQQIRAQHTSFPITEIVGEPNTGKSILLMFLGSLFGNDHYEGVNLGCSTRAGRLRILSQADNTPVVFIEACRHNWIGENRSQFKWEELKPLYDGGKIGARWMKSCGNETYEPLFKGTLIISQNLNVKASHGFMSRICKMRFTHKTTTPETKEAAERILAYRAEDLGAFLPAARSKEAVILETYFNAKPIYEKQLIDLGIQSSRVAHNHAQFAALFDALKAHVLPELEHISDRVHAEIVHMAKSRDDFLQGGAA